MDNPQQKLPVLTISMPEIFNETKSLDISIDWEKDSNPDDTLRLIIMTIYEDMSDLVIKAISNRGIEKKDTVFSQTIINKFVEARKILSLQNHNRTSRHLVVDPEDIFRHPQRPIL